MPFNPRLFNNIFYPQQEEEDRFDPGFSRGYSWNSGDQGFNRDIPDGGSDDGFFKPGKRVQSQFKNMFDSPNFITHVAPEDRYTGAYTPKPSDEFGRRFGMMAEQEGPAQTAYKQFLETQPTREGSRPGKLDRFAAILSGVTQGLKDPTQGMKMAQYFRDRKYNENIEDFKLKGAGMKERAEEERQGMTSKRTIMNDIYKQMLDEKKYKSEEELRNAQIRNYDSQSAERDKPQASDFVRIETPTGYAYHNVQTGERIESGQPGMTQYQKEQIRIADANAKSNRIRADKYQPGGSGGRSGYTEFTPPQDEVSAGKAAVENVILNNPDYAQFRGMDPSAGTWFGGLAGNNPDFAKFTAAVKLEKDRILESGRRSRRAANPGDGMMDLDDVLAGLPDN